MRASDNEGEHEICPRCRKVVEGDTHTIDGVHRRWVGVCSDDPEFWNPLADAVLGSHTDRGGLMDHLMNSANVVLESHPDRGRLMGHLMNGATDEDLADPNLYVSHSAQWESYRGGWQITNRHNPVGRIEKGCHTHRDICN